MWKLVIEDDEGKRTVVPLTRDDYTLGRREGNTIRLTERNVSRDHALLRKKMNGAGATFTLHDCSSYNGVYVNGVRVVEGQDLQHGDLIQIGDYRLILQDDTVTDQPAAPTSTEDGKTTLPLGTRGSLLLERPNRFVMLAGPTPGAEFPLTLERMTIGRAEDASISVNHNSVSRVHCEIHSLGESRFEIVDKGSSNGVRVNGADLRRGIMEAGDVIELGDVRFKFVGAGQVFVPGVNESAQLEAIGDRVANAALRQGTNPKAIWFLVFAVMALLAVGAFVLLRQPPEVVQPLPPGPQDQEAGALAEAKKLCASADCEKAYERLQQGIAITSPLRDSDDFKMIVGAWADHRMERAQNEVDAAKRKALLEPVARSASVDPNRRRNASDRLATAEALLAAPPITVPSSATPTAPTREAGSTPSPVTAKTPGPTAPKPTPAPAAGGNVSEKVRALMLEGPDGLKQAKELLTPRVFGGKASRQEIDLLRIVCKDMKDQVCVSRCKEMLAGQP